MHHATVRGVKRGRSAIRLASKRVIVQRTLVLVTVAMLACTLLLGGAICIRQGVFSRAERLLDGTGATAETQRSHAPEPALLNVEERVVRMTDEEANAGETAKETSTNANAPRVLIYHTHTTEAYRQTDETEYEESGSWRTRDAKWNVTALGARLSELLNEKYGICALHDATDHEPPKLSSAYGRSEETMRAYQKRYPSIEYYIDVHRDAFGSSDSGRTDHVLIDGKETARLMFVVGTGAGATGTGFDEMPDFAGNLAFAQDVTDRLSRMGEGLTREVRVKTGRYNQHLSSHCLLAEVGHNANTFPQAMAALELLAEAIAESIYHNELKNAADDALPVWAPQH